MSEPWDPCARPHCDSCPGTIIDKCTHVCVLPDGHGGAGACAMAALRVWPSRTLASLRAAGWAVAVHNDYRQGGRPMTFWLFTKGDRCAKGEGPTDEDALRQVVAQVMKIQMDL